MPNVEDGYTRIADELLDAIAVFPFTSREYSIVLLVVRQTYGYDRLWDDMTMTQVSERTGIALPHCGKTVTELVTRGILFSEDGRYGRKLKLNKHYRQWGYQNSKPVLTKTVTPTGGYRISKLRLPKQSHRVTKTVSTGYQKSKHNRDTQQTTPIENSNRQRARKGAPRATKRMPTDWSPSTELVQQMLREKPGVNQDEELAVLRDHEFRSAKKDWAAVYRNWMRRSTNFNGGQRKNGSNQPTAKTEYEKGMDLIARMEAEDAAAENKNH